MPIDTRAAAIDGKKGKHAAVDTRILIPRQYDVVSACPAVTREYFRLLFKVPAMTINVKIYSRFRLPFLKEDDRHADIVVA